MLPRLSRHDALARLRNCLENGIVEPHPHFLRALQDDGLDLADAMLVLRAGAIYDEPEFDPRFRDWRYRIGRQGTGRKLAGHCVHVQGRGRNPVDHWLSEKKIDDWLMYAPR